MHTNTHTQKTLYKLIDHLEIDVPPQILEEPF